ncbi:MAG: hypothetical protein A2Y41_13165 [Spirochaetes bacterium GWB1_36_13]|nr:MAG: hypothetical protein A2Y41_13165 [Spirochaetes bacterium GWB1_36_13]
MQNAFLAGLLSSFAFGTAGSFVVIKRLAGLSGGIAHAVLGGIGLAYYFHFPTILGALGFALISAFILGTVKMKAKQREDTVIAALWSVGMAGGIILMFFTPGYQSDLLNYLFADILLISKSYLWLLFGLDVFIFVVFFFFYRHFVYLSFDEDYTALRGLPVYWLNILLLCMIALTIIILIQVVGLILVIAMLTLPSAIAGLFVKRLSRMILLSTVLGVFFIFSGIVLSVFLNLPAGATIILFCGISYLIAINVKRIVVRHRKRLKKSDG